MTLFVRIAVVLFLAYLSGSIPTAVLISKHVRRVDIRSIGDGNMGARNTFHQIGPKFGITVAIIDFSKGALPVLLAHLLGLSSGWQMLTGILAIAGHDFPVFAGFKGGQGTATSLGTMMVLFPVPTAIGLIVYGTLYLIIRNSNISCGTGGGIIAAILAFSQNWPLLIYAVGVFVFIPVKLLLDHPRREAIEIVKSSRN
jgi:acyl phosphate:glycerol-3-phosphate acyltransferase